MMCCRYTMDFGSFNSYCSKVIMHYTELTTLHVVHKKQNYFTISTIFLILQIWKNIFRISHMWKRDMQNKPVPPQGSNKNVCRQTSATIAHKWLFFKTLYIECICEEVCRTLTGRKNNKSRICNYWEASHLSDMYIRILEDSQGVFTRWVISDGTHHIGHRNFVCIMCIFCSNVSGIIFFVKNNLLFSWTIFCCTHNHSRATIGNFFPLRSLNVPLNLIYV